MAGPSEWLWERSVDVQGGLFRIDIFTFHGDGQELFVFHCHKEMKRIYNLF